MKLGQEWADAQEPPDHTSRRRCKPCLRLVLQAAEFTVRPDDMALRQGCCLAHGTRRRTPSIRATATTFCLSIKGKRCLLGVGASCILRIYVET